MFRGGRGISWVILVNPGELHHSTWKYRDMALIVSGKMLTRVGIGDDLARLISLSKVKITMCRQVRG